MRRVGLNPTLGAILYNIGCNIKELSAALVINICTRIAHIEMLLQQRTGESRNGPHELKKLYTASCETHNISSNIGIMCVVPVVVDPPQRATRVIPVKKCVCKLYGWFRNFFAIVSYTRGFLKPNIIIFILY